MNGFEDRLRRTLREQEDALDGGTLARIGRARRAALATPRPAWWRLHAPALGGAVLATAVAVAVLLPLQQGQFGVRQDRVEEPGFYEDLDFYLWLAESDMGQHG
jgi:hypothetical protein